MTNSNPLLDKYFELYPEKKEKPKVIKAENAKIAIKGNQIGYSDKTSVIASNTNISITKPRKITTYDLDDLKASFQQVAEKIKNDEVEVVSMNMEFGDYMNKITFEVYVYKP
jgi:CRISPR/Cas system CMR subunit Cmr4 (Cas7 group RAMP superfamily)